MKTYDIELNILACIVMKPELINELFIELSCFEDSYNKKILSFFKIFYDKYKCLDLTLMAERLSKKNQDEASKFVVYYTELLDLLPTPSMFYEYQQELIENYKTKLIKQEIQKFSNDDMSSDDLVEAINKINNDTMVIKQSNKVSPDNMLKMIRNKDKLIEFDRFNGLNRILKIKKKTINVVGARPSEGKSALALNLFCDLSKTYKCLYFNMEMTEEEVYERMIAIESNIPIKDINKPATEYQEKAIVETAKKIYTYKYEVINGSKTVRSIKNKIIREQKDGHVIVFIDYIGYIVGKPNQNDKERIGEAVRELNNITKDYDCTIFLIAQINRNGSDMPTMQDLKDSGEIEQTADTIILIYDENKTDNSDIKEINFIIPKCRGGKRNVRIPVIFDKPKQIMRLEEKRW